MASEESKRVLLIEGPDYVPPKEAPDHPFVREIPAPMTTRRTPAPVPIAQPRPSAIPAPAPSVDSADQASTYTATTVFPLVPIIPVEYSVIAWSDPLGAWTDLVCRDDVLYFDGRKVVLHLEDEQRRPANMLGHNLRKALVGKRTLHPNVLDKLFEDLRLIPKSWRQDDQGRARCIFFWAVGFRSSGGGLYVRCLRWDCNECRWHRDVRWLSDWFDTRDPAAILAS